MLRSPPRYSDPSLPPLDDADRKLIAMLIADGRASGRELAQQTGLSEANVSRRLARLIEERSLRIVGFVPPELLGMHVQFAALLRVKGDVDDAARELMRHPEFSFVVAAFGAYDMLAYGVVEDTRALASLLDRSLHSCKLFHDIDTRIALEFADPAGTHGAACVAREIDRTDRLIIREIQEDGRVSFTDIAHKTGISATSAADRFRKLAADGIVRIMALPDPTRVGLHLSGLIGVAPLQPVREVIASLSAFPELSFFTVMSGGFPIRFEFNVRDGQHFDQLRERILDLPGIDDITVSVHRRMYRQSFVWGAPAAE